MRVEQENDELVGWDGALGLVLYFGGGSRLFLFGEHEKI